MLYPAILSALVIMLASLSGILFASRRLESWVDRNLPYLITFSVGVLGVSTYGLFTEAIEHTSLWTVLITAFGGFIFVKIAGLLIPDAHHHHETNTTHPHSKIDARHILLGDAVHNIVDGLLIVPAFMVDIRIGLATALGIFLHELVQEISEFFILKKAGYSTRRALISNFLVSGSIFIGIGLSLWLSSIESIEAPLIGFAAGGFLYVLLRDLIPSTFSSAKRSPNKKAYALALLLGIATMASVGVLAPHAHEEIHADEEVTIVENTHVD